MDSHQQKLINLFKHFTRFCTTRSPYTLTVSIFCFFVVKRKNYTGLYRRRTSIIFSTFLRIIWIYVYKSWARDLPTTCRQRQRVQFKYTGARDDVLMCCALMHAYLHIINTAYNTQESPGRPIRALNITVFDAVITTFDMCAGPSATRGANHQKLFNR